MRYMLLIYSSEAEEAQMNPDDMGQLLAGFGQLHQDLVGANVYLGSERLQSTTDATTVRVRGGETATTDGPFAETKEAIGGYYLIDVANLDEAIAWAAKVPTATYGSIEIRPIWEMEKPEG